MLKNDSSSIKEVKEEVKVRIDATDNVTFFHKGIAFFGVLITEDMKGCLVSFGALNAEQLILVEQVLVKGLQEEVSERMRCKN